MRAKLTSKNIFLIISLLLTIVLGGASYFVAKKQFTNYLANNYRDTTSNYINTIASKYFDLSATTSLRQSGHQTDFINDLTKDSDIKGAKLTDANGTIIASTNKSEVGQVILDNNNWESAITGTAEISGLSYTAKTAELYLPLVSPGNNARGVVVLDSALPANFSMVDSFTKNIVYTIIGTTLLFILIAYITIYELEDRMAAKERSLFDNSKAQTEEKQLYEAITASLAESLVVINKNSQILFINPEAEKMLGKKSADIEYRSYEKIITFFDGDGKKIRHNPIAESISKGHIIHISSKDEYHIKQNSKLVPIAINIAPIVGEKSFTKGVALTINDISSEEELQKVKDEFVYVVAHELGNPIFALDGYLSLLQDRKKKLDKESLDILTGARNINQQLSCLVNDLLEVARNETGRLTFDLEKISLAEITNEVIKNSQFKAHEKNIKLTSKIAKTPRAVGNERKIKEVLTNLIDNAIKYTPKNGRVEINLFQHDDRIVVSISDNGVGISAENQKHLFEKFYRVKNKATEGISGTGLGLFIGKQIVEKCGGKIWAKSEEAKGSTFSFSLKIAK